jgi:hypothetical protein
MQMPGGSGTGGEGQPPFGDILREALKGIRSEILLYGIVVIVIIVGSAQFGIAILRELEVPLLLFATFVLIVYLILAWSGARERLVTRKSGKGQT